jgi:hypothetical protein
MEEQGSPPSCHQSVKKRKRRPVPWLVEIEGRLVSTATVKGRKRQTNKTKS